MQRTKTAVHPRCGLQLEEPPDIVERLLSAGPDADLVDKTGRTALMWACEKSDFDSARLLLEYGAKIEIQDNDGKTALDKAEELDLSDLTELLRQYL